MHKKIVIMLSVLFFMGSNNALVGAQKFNDFFAGSEFNQLKKVGLALCIGATVVAGNWATKLNKEYTQKKQDPDWKMRLSKALGGVALIVGTDIVTGSGFSDTKESLIKLGAATIAMLAVTSPSVSKFMYYNVPVVGGFLSDPRRIKTKDNKEIDKEKQPDYGAFIRGLLIYMPLNALGKRYLLQV
jgi:hypothetical protein